MQNDHTTTNQARQASNLEQAAPEKSSIGQPKWLILGVRPRNEKAVLTILIQEGIKADLPMQRQLRQWAKRKKWVEAVLVPGYLFVQHDEHDLARLFTYVKQGSIWPITIGHEKLYLTAADLQRFYAISRYEKPVTVSRQHYSNAQKVRVTYGTLAGQEGRIIKDDDRHCLLLEIFGHGDLFLKTEIDRDCVEPIS